YGLNKTFRPKEEVAKNKAPGQRYPIGFVTSALAFNYLEHALQEMGLVDQVPILKLGVTYPLDPNVITEFAKDVEMLVVVEERRGFIEEQIALIFTQHAIAVPLYGKQFPFELPGLPAARGLNPSVLIEHLGPLLLKIETQRLLPLDVTKVQRELD